MDRLRIATRKSPLALWQATHVRELILQRRPKMRVEIVSMSTTGDRTRDRSLVAQGGKGVFLKELENLLLIGEAELAVHSMKDVPLALPESLAVTTVGRRGDIRDAYVGGPPLDKLPRDACIGSASLRRTALVNALWNRTNVESVRGNVQTRLRKLDEGGYDALILAAAGLQRLELQNRITHFLDPTTFVPAVGQGALAVEYAVARDDLGLIIAEIRKHSVELGVMAERQVTRRLGADCAMPIGVYSEIRGTGARIITIVLSPNGEQSVRVEMEGKDALSLADRVSDRLLKLGADALMSSV